MTAIRPPTKAKPQAYMEKVVDDFGLRGYFKTSHEVVVPDGKREEAFEDWCNFFINGSGAPSSLSSSISSWPDIKGLHNFNGKFTHTAAWDRSFSLKVKKVALIGVGSSALQVQDLDYTLFCGQYAGPGGCNFDCDDESKEEFRKAEVKHREYIQNI
ncbi:hypothetical protein BT69DRAFT_1344811 [Atractiella rhizophila]|nr:hypothetical protein BT69DRAFT_1344811 [Atractiella rhizophila]